MCISVKTHMCIMYTKCTNYNSIIGQQCLAWELFLWIKSLVRTLPFLNRTLSARLCPSLFILYMYIRWSIIESVELYFKQKSFLRAKKYNIHLPFCCEVSYKDRLIQCNLTPLTYWFEYCFPILTPKTSARLTRWWISSGGTKFEEQRSRQRGTRNRTRCDQHDHEMHSADRIRNNPN